MPNDYPPPYASIDDAPPPWLKLAAHFLPYKSLGIVMVDCHKWPWQRFPEPIDHADLIHQCPTGHRVVLTLRPFSWEVFGEDRRAWLNRCDRCGAVIWATPEAGGK